MIRVRCKDCKSPAVGRDAWVIWDYEARRWEIEAVFDHAECLDCGSESIEEYDHERISTTVGPVD